jgi:hypothetical protein|tara:strand:+ start:309 stop:443 length:135 start_codon:yes stop_codon:yes gene_type:complete
LKASGSPWPGAFLSFDAKLKPEKLKPEKIEGGIENGPPNLTATR